MKPSVGRIVHFVPYTDGPCVAAIVTTTDPLDRGVLQLVVFDADGNAFAYRSGVSFEHDVPGKPTTLGGGRSWHWPERVDEPEGR